MGLLDDAIREHLELKRLRGADPGYVAREEDAALGPVHPRDEPEPAVSREDHIEATSPEQQAQTTHATPPSNSSAGQETVEINMEAELAGSDPEHGASSSAVHDTPVTHPDHEQTSGGESLEWEMPGDRHADPNTTHGDGHGDEDRSGSDHPEGGVDPPVEDVLEETPDFLRDTPEQERLWFEQRPPRDFDFNE
ncbi:MAG: hypothetical protein WBV85_01600 [Solirubrobacteraceae bacterium]